MQDWFHQVRQRIENRVDELKKIARPNHVKDTLNMCIDSLAQLQERFIIAPIDKATGNIAIICKRHYASVLVKELGLLNNNNPMPTYEVVNNISSEDIINRNVNDLSKLFGITDAKEDNHCLPRMYWLPKMHKNPTKARFIVAAPKCSVKPLSKTVTSVFKLFFKQIESYNNKSKFFSGVNTFWVIQNNKPVTDAIKNLNKRNRARSISTFDFSTLYTKIPHDKLIFVLHSLIDFCFNGGICDYIGVTDYGSHWVNDHSKYTIWFDRKRIKDAVSYLLSNCYFTIGKKLFRQIIGIPMGSDPAPFFANLFLYYYENKWLVQLKKNDLCKARKFSNTFRFIDDLNAMNDCGEFERHCHEIYPDELELGKENLNDSEASFLDLDIRIVDQKFEVSLFDKRDEFPFSIVRMPCASSNIPSTIFYNSIGAEILRIARANSLSDKFVPSCKQLLNRMLNQGARRDKVTNVIKNFFGRHSTDFSHIACDAQSFLNLILD